MKLFTTTDNKLGFNSDVIDAIRWCKSDSVVEIEQWLLPRDVPVAWNLMSQDVMEAIFFETQENSKATIRLIVAPGDIRHVLSGWPQNAPIYSGEWHQPKKLTNVRLCVVLSNEEICDITELTYSRDNAEWIIGKLRQAVVEEFRSLGPLCGGLEYKIGDGKPVKVIE